MFVLVTKNFGSVNLGDQRRTRRLVESAAQIAAHPEKPFNQVFNWNDLRGFYRLCHQETATLQALQEPHWQRTREEMAKQSLVLILHDTSEMDFTEHAALEGAGPIGDGKGRGFLQHNSLAIVPQPRRVWAWRTNNGAFARRRPKRSIRPSASTGTANRSCGCEVSRRQVGLRRDVVGSMWATVVPTFMRRWWRLKRRVMTSCFG